MYRHLWFVARNLVSTAALALVLWAVDRPAPAVAAETLCVHMLSGAKEYDSEASLEKLKKHLEANYAIACTHSRGHDGCTEFPELDSLDKADVLVVFCRRTEPGEGQLAKIKQWCAEGKPVVGIRTASHAFQDWLAFDKEVLGGDYKGHYGQDVEVEVRLAQGAEQHPVLLGIKAWNRPGKLYKNPNLAGDVALLLSGRTEKASEPLAWCRCYGPNRRGRAFYTSMGVPSDFDDEMFLRLLSNAVAWSARRDLASK